MEAFTYTRFQAKELLICHPYFDTSCKPLLSWYRYSLPITHCFPMTEFRKILPVPTLDPDPTTTSCSSMQSLAEKINLRLTLFFTKLFSPETNHHRSTPSAPFSSLNHSLTNLAKSTPLPKYTLCLLYMYASSERRILLSGTTG